MSEEHKHSGHGCCGHEHDGRESGETPRETVFNDDIKATKQTTLRVAGMDSADEVEAERAQPTAKQPQPADSGLASRTLYSHGENES